MAVGGCIVEGDVCRKGGSVGGEKGLNTRGCTSGEYSHGISEGCNNSQAALTLIKYQHSC